MSRQLQVRQLAVRSLLPVTVRGLSALASIALVYFLSLRLDADEVGAFFWCMALVGVLGALTRVGLDNVLVREAALIGRHGAAQSLADLLPSALCVILPPLLLAVVVLALQPGAVASLQSHAGVEAVLPGFAVVLFCSVLVLLASRLLIGLQRPAAGLAVEGVLQPLLFISLAWILAENNLASMTRFYAIAAIVALVIAAVLILCGRIGVPSAASRFTVRDLLARGLPLWVAMVMADVTLWGGMLIVGMMSPAREVALLAVAQRVASVVSLILQGVRAVVAPRFAALYAAGEREGLRKLARASALVNFAWAAPLLSLVFLMPEQILSLFGEDYVAARNLLLILAVGQMVNAGVGNWGALLAMTGHEVALRNISIGCGAITLVMLPLGVLAAGLVGAAVVMATAVILQNVLTMRFGQRVILADRVQQA